jgi:hypothetical protein
MPQVFSSRADRRFRLAILLSAAVVAVTLVLAFAQARSGSAWGVGRPAAQPIPFSHAVHAGGLGLDCRFCHAAVETGAAAGMPTAETCLGCHERVWNVTAQFAPLTSALALDAPVAWSSVHRLPDHVRFHHGAHVQAGVTCQTCHGPVWDMPRTVAVQPLSMGWCVDCHRDSASQRPEAWSREGAVARAFDRAAPPATPPVRPFGVAAHPVRHQGVEISLLTNCSTCHR